MTRKYSVFSIKLRKYHKTEDLKGYHQNKQDSYELLLHFIAEFVTLCYRLSYSSHV